MHSNLFIAPNFKEKLNKVILDILQGVQTKLNQQKLNQLRKNDHYPVNLCQLLVELTELPLLSHTTLQCNKKIFIALEIKKIVARIKNQQCWRLIREAYFNEPNSKVVGLIRQTCLLYRADDKNHNLIFLFFDVDLSSKGLIGLGRYLMFLHEMIRQQFRTLENETLKEYGEDIVKKLREALEWSVGEFAYESILTGLILLHGLMMEKECWANTGAWENLLERMLDGEKSDLMVCLARHLMQQISSSGNQAIKQTGLQMSEITQALNYCLQKAKIQRRHIEEWFYFDCIQILGVYWVKGVRNISSHKRLEENMNLALDIVQNYSEYFTVVDGEREQLVDFSEDQFDQIQVVLTDKKLSFLKTVLYLFPQHQLMTAIQSRTSSYGIQIMQFSLHLPCLVRDGFVPLVILQTLMDNLASALGQQVDTHLFVKDKSTFIWTLLRYIAKFHATFDTETTLKICYLIDYLVYMCDTIAKEGFEILDQLTQKILDLQGFVLQEFLFITLTHINTNQWLESHNCYFHAINILLNLNTELVFERPKESSYGYSFSQLQKQILTMIRKIISLLGKQFNYDSMFKLNSLLQHILQPCARHLVHALRYDEISWVVMTNFKYEILNEASGEIYFYFVQFSESRLTFIENLERYDFWKECDSERMIFFVQVYLKLIDSKQNFFTSSEAEHKVKKLRKHLKERYMHEIDDEEREKMIEMFAQNKKFFAELLVEAWQVQKWAQNGKQQHFRSSNSRERMEIE